MARYVLRRLFLFLPTLAVISFIAFGVSQCTPGDPALPEEELDPRAFDRAYRQRAEQLGRHLPVFYLSVTTAAYPDTLHRILRADHRRTLRQLIGRYGHWPSIAGYYQQLRVVEARLAALPDTLAGLHGPVRARGLLPLLLTNADPLRIPAWLDTLHADALRDTPILASDMAALRSRYEAVVQQATPHRHWMPAVHWHGLDNQYHRWATRFLRGDFGVSYRSGVPVADLLRTPIRWTLTINLLALALVFSLSIGIGVYAAAYKGGRFDRWSSTLLFMLHSLPNFWVATLLIVFLTTPQYGLNLFPSMGLGNLPDMAPWWDRFRETAYHLVLPVFCVTYGALAYVSRQMRGGMLAVLRQDYIRTARAKGLPERQVLWHHAFRNGLFPLITLFAGVFPAALSGSLVVEVIFSIPGMGQKMVQAIFTQDWPIVYTVLMLGAVLTVVGIFVADLLYAWADPRVALQNKKPRS